jgi:hypothetical protein
VPDVAGFFGAGGLLLVAMLTITGAALRRPPRRPIASPGWLGLARLGARQLTSRPGRSLLCVALIAFATFVIVSVEAFRKDAGTTHHEKHSGTGGFPLVATSSLPVFEDPNTLIMDRKGNRHFSFGIGVHRCVGSNVARTVFKSMLTAVLDRMPDYVCDPEGTVHYETIGVIQGMKHLPATFTPSKPLGPGLDETLKKLQRICDEQQPARPITEHKDAVVID